MGSVDIEPENPTLFLHWHELIVVAALIPVALGKCYVAVVINKDNRACASAICGLQVCKRRDKDPMLEIFQRLGYASVVG